MVSAKGQDRGTVKVKVDPRASNEVASPEPDPLSNTTVRAVRSKSFQSVESVAPEGLFQVVTELVVTS